MLGYSIVQCTLLYTALFVIQVPVHTNNSHTLHNILIAYSKNSTINGVVSYSEHSHSHHGRIKQVGYSFIQLCHQITYNVFIRNVFIGFAGVNKMSLNVYKHSTWNWLESLERNINSIGESVCVGWAGRVITLCGTWRALNAAAVMLGWSTEQKCLGEEIVARVLFAHVLVYRLWNRESLQICLVLNVVVHVIDSNERVLIIKFHD